MHNPANLTDEQIVVSRGWRLYTLAECQGRSHPGDLQWWSETSGRWTSVTNAATRTSRLNTDLTYRTKAPSPDPLFADLEDRVVAATNPVEVFKQWVRTGMGSATEWAKRCLDDRVGFNNACDNPAVAVLYALLYRIYDGGNILPRSVVLAADALSTALTDWTRANMPREQATNPHQTLCNILSTL